MYLLPNQPKKYVVLISMKVWCVLFLVLMEFSLWKMIINVINTDNKCIVWLFFPPIYYSFNLNLNASSDIRNRTIIIYINKQNNCLMLLQTSLELFSVRIGKILCLPYIVRHLFFLFFFYLLHTEFLECVQQHPFCVQPASEV